MAYEKTRNTAAGGKTITLVERMVPRRGRLPWTGAGGPYGMGAVNTSLRAGSGTTQFVATPPPAMPPPGTVDPNADIAAATAAAADNTSNTTLYLGVGAAALVGLLLWKRHKKAHP